MSRVLRLGVQECPGCSQVLFMRIRLVFCQSSCLESCLEVMSNRLAHTRTRLGGTSLVKYSVYKCLPRASSPTMPRNYRSAMTRARADDNTHSGKKALLTLGVPDQGGIGSARPFPRRKAGFLCRWVIRNLLHPGRSGTHGSDGPIAVSCAGRPLRRCNLSSPGVGTLVAAVVPIRTPCENRLR